MTHWQIALACATGALALLGGVYTAFAARGRGPLTPPGARAAPRTPAKTETPQEGGAYLLFKRQRRLESF